MEEPAISVLNTNRTMAISTIRTDGWPQTTIVGYANEGWAVYFLIFRSSQKWANIIHDDRISIAVAGDTQDLHDVKAVYAGAHAAEVTNPAQLEHAWRLLIGRHPNLADFDPPDRSQAAIMRADCKYVSMLDYSKGLGHTEALTIGAEESITPPQRREDWGKSAARPKPTDAEKPD